MIKSSLVWLIIGMSLGLRMLFRKSTGGSFYEWVSPHTHILLVGFLMQFIMGVALWFFPRTSKQPSKEKITGYLTWILRNIGTLLRIMENRYNYVALIGGTLQFLSILVFVFIAWKRIRAPGMLK